MTDTSAPEDLGADDLLTYYYLRPTPALLDPILRALTVANRPGTTGRGLLVVWLAAVVRAGGSPLATRVASLRDRVDAELLDLALARAEAEPGSAGPASTDACWAMYFATGELGPVSEIVARLDDDAAGIVAWSVRSNAYQHARIRRFIEDTAARMPSSRARATLLEIITQVDARIVAEGRCQAELRARATLDRQHVDEPADALTPEQTRERIARLRADADSLPDAEFEQANKLRDQAIVLLERLREADPLAGTTLANVIVDRAYSLQGSDPAAAAEQFERAQTIFTSVGTPTATRNSIEVGFYRAIALREARDPRAEAVAKAAFAAAELAVQSPGLIQATQWARAMLRRLEDGGA